MSIAQQVLDEHDLYPVHEEDTVPDIPEHELQTRYLRDALAAQLPGRFVTGEICMYWRRGDKRSYVAPDVVVVDHPRQQPDSGPPAIGDETRLPRVYLKWLDARALFVIEVGSDSTFRRDEGPKVERYLTDLGVGEYLYCHAARERLRMWRLVDGAPQEVPANERGRMESRELDLEFGLDAGGFLWVYTPDGERLPTYQEERSRAAGLELELERLRTELGRRSGKRPQASGTE